MIRQFFDTNVLLYAFKDDQRSGMARELVASGGVIALQSLNEFVNVARRKLEFDWPAVHHAIASLLGVCRLHEVTRLQTQQRALSLAERYQINVHDAMLLSIALEAGCDAFISEDLQDGLIVEDRITVRNPFKD